MFFTKRRKPEIEAGENEPREQPQLAELCLKVQQAELPRRVQDVVAKEIDKLERTDSAAAEYSVGVNYVEYVIGLPWNRQSVMSNDLARARRLLDAHHSGLSEVKQRILEFLAARTLRGSMRAHVLVVDDEEIARQNMAHVLQKDGYQCHLAENGLRALEILDKVEIDLVVTDLKMDRMDGMTLLAHITNRWPDIRVIIVTGFATIHSAVEAVKKGAAHYLGKPVNLDELRKTAREVLEKKLTLEVGQGPILCFAGPPGTGKTSVGKSIAEALGRRFARISLAGMRDEAELRGHRRTYVGAMPGRLITEINRVEVNNPVMMLDEIDKIGQDFHGDPASVLLEVLDAEQNARFVDHYLDVAFDLSGVMFIATANDLSSLPRPLLDRMEVVEFAGYALKEKVEIARQFVIPRQLKATGLGRADVHFTEDAVCRIISDYTRESGLRSLEREVGHVCRKIAYHCLEEGKGDGALVVDAKAVGAFLGPCRYYREAARAEDAVGIATGLVWSEAGGEILSIETAKMVGSGSLILTGSLGEVLQESARAALSLIRSRAEEFGVDHALFRQYDLHIHLPYGAITKDGPSAGIAIFAALFSLLTDRPVRGNVALTGEMTLSGRVLAVSGIREKLLAAQRAGIEKVLLPLANRDELAALAPEVTEGLEVVLVGGVAEILEHAVGPESATMN